MKLGIWLTATFSIFVTSIATAAKMSSYCYAPLSDIKRVEGENVNERIPIASVSKLVTSYWAVKSKGVQYRFQTVVYIDPVADDLYDLHMQGSRDPYLGAEQMHYMISELNKRGIKNIRKFTYDENFKFLWFSDDPDSNRSIAVGFYINSDPQPDKVQSQLRAYAKLTQGYDETFEKAKKKNVSMIENPDFSVESFEFLPSKEFTPSQKTKVYSINSVTLSRVLKEMNRNSNNHAANQIFEHLGSSEEFATFSEKNLGLKKDSVHMLNGSGDRVDTAQGARYNEASCSAMIKILADLQATLESQNSSLTRIATVVGTDPGSATSLYTSDTLFDAVVAKTGTVNPAVTLAGLVSTKTGPYFFMFNVAPQGSFGGARAIIRNKLNDLMQQLGGRVALKGQGFSFISFDDKSFSELIKIGKLP